MRVASKVGNLPSKFRHARLLGSRIIRYVCDGRTLADGRTDGQTKATLIAPFSTVGNIIIKTSKKVKRSILCDATKFLQFERYPYATERLEQRRCQSFDRSARLFVISAHDIWRMGNTRYVIPI